MTERKMFTKEEASALEGCVVRSVKGVAVRLLRKWPSGNFAVCYAGEDAKEYYACYDIRALTCPWDIAEVLERPEKPMHKRKIFTKEEAESLEGCTVRLVDGDIVRLSRQHFICTLHVVYLSNSDERYYACFDSRSCDASHDIAEVLERPKKPEPAVDEAKVRETFIRMVYEAAMQIDCEKIQRMMKAVDWRWGDEVPSVDQVRDRLLDFCAKLIRDTKKVRPMAGLGSGGWYFIVDRNTDEDGPWLRVYLGWGEVAGNFEGETIT
jgi:hypothetical protein